MTIQNALITNTFLGYENHGILTFSLGLDGDGCYVVYGHRALDEYSKKSDKRVPVDRGLACIAEVLNVVGVKKWEDLKGKYVRVKMNCLGDRVTKIGHIIEDKWFDLDEFFSKEDSK